MLLPTSWNAVHYWGIPMRSRVLYGARPYCAYLYILVWLLGGCRPMSLGPVLREHLRSGRFLLCGLDIDNRSELAPADLTRRRCETKRMDFGGTVEPSA